MCVRERESEGTGEKEMTKEKREKAEDEKVGQNVKAIGALGAFLYRLLILLDLRFSRSLNIE